MTAPGAAPIRPPRPTSVTVACWLQIATVLILLGLVALAAYEAVRFDGEISRAARLVPTADPAEVRDERSANVFGTLFVGVPVLLLAGWLAGTALPLLRGRNVARVLVFVSGGGQLLLCLAQACGGALLFPLVLVLGLSEGIDPEGIDPEGMGPDGEPFPEEGFWQESKFLETLYERQDAHDAVIFPVIGLGVLTVLLLSAAVVLLLALPPANRYFRPRPQPPAGPMPYVGWPSPPLPPAGPVAPVGGWLPPGYAVPPGYVICPAPALHLAHPPTPPGPAPAPPVSPSPGPTDSPAAPGS
ncbi:hypothetical protein [Micromonospora sp. DT233]|uniref:hypothetical protein n=1 Tax=Micromonospora sp. DT233 TaxID=3393432 RepID=UPI003CE7065E